MHLARCCTSSPSPASSPSASLLHLGVVYGVGVAVIAATLAYEQRIVSPTDLSRVDKAFFDLNGYVSLAFAVCAVVEALR